MEQSSSTSPAGEEMTLILIGYQSRIRELQYILARLAPGTIPHIIVRARLGRVRAERAAYLARHLEYKASLVAGMEGKLDDK